MSEREFRCLGALLVAVAEFRALASTLDAAQKRALEVAARLQDEAEALNSGHPR